MAVNSCEFMAHINRRYLDNLTKARISSIILYSKFLLKMSDDICPCEGQIIKVTPNNLLLQAKVSQELTGSHISVNYIHYKQMRLIGTLL